MNQKTTLKKFAQKIETYLNEKGYEPKHSHCLELSAKLNGFENWNTAQACADTPIQIFNQFNKDQHKKYYLVTTSLTKEKFVTLINDLVKYTSTDKLKVKIDAIIGEKDDFLIVLTDFDQTLLFEIYLNAFSSKQFPNKEKLCKSWKRPSHLDDMQFISDVKSKTVTVETTDMSLEKAVNNFQYFLQKILNSKDYEKISAIHINFDLNGIQDVKIRKSGKIRSVTSFFDKSDFVSFVTDRGMKNTEIYDQINSEIIELKGVSVPKKWKKVYVTSYSFIVSGGLGISYVIKPIEE